MTFRQSDEHFGQSVVPAGDQADRRALFGNAARQRGPNPGGRPGDEHPLTRGRERHG